MRNLYYMDFGNGRVVKGEGYGELFRAIFQESATDREKMGFLFGAALDAVLFGADVISETLQVLRASTAIFFRQAKGRWTAVRYESIITEGMRKTRIDDAQGLFQEVFPVEAERARPLPSKKSRRKKRR